MNGGTCLHETPGQRLPRGRKKNVRCNRSSLLTNSLPYKEGHGHLDATRRQRIESGGDFKEAKLGHQALDKLWRVGFRQRRLLVSGDLRVEVESWPQGAAPNSSALRKRQATCGIR